MESTFDGMQFDHRVKEKAGRTISQRMKPLSIIYSVLFLAIFIGTTLTPKESLMAKGFSIYIFGLSGILFLLTHLLQKNPKSQARRFFYLGVLLMGASWGLASAYSQYVSVLGWTNFIIILMTLFVSASQLGSLAPDIRLLVSFQSVLLLPSAFINFYSIGGTQGYLVGSFFAGFCGVFSFLGWIQYRQYWKVTQSHARIEGIVEGMPGTLAWVSSDKKFLRVNKKMADFFDKDVKEVQDQSFSAAPDFAQSYFKKLFSKKDERVSGLVEKERKKYFLTGQKYNQGSEAIVLGIDVTDQHLVQEQLEFQRAQSQASARYAGLGEVIGTITRDLSSKFDEGSKDLEFVWPVIHLLATSQYSQEKEFDLSELVREAEAFFRHQAEKKKVEFLVELPEQPVIVEAHRGDIFLTLLNLINNAFEAVARSEEKRVEVQLISDGESHRLEVTDHGAGVPDYLKEVIFEPNFTTKEAKGSTGLGLSLSKQLVEANLGSLTLDSHEKPTRFRVALKKK